MKNPFEKTSNTALVGSIVVGSIAAGLITFFFLTEKGKELRGNTKKKIKKIAKDEAAKAISKKTGVPRKAVKALTDKI